MRTAIGDRPNLITLEVPGGNIYSPGWTALTPPTAYGKVQPAAQADVERIAGGATTLTMASRLVTIPHHAGVTTQTRLSWTDRHGAAHVANVSGVAHNADESETVLLCEEVLP